MKALIGAALIVANCLAAGIFHLPRLCDTKTTQQAPPEIILPPGLPAIPPSDTNLRADRRPADLPPAPRYETAPDSKTVPEPEPPARAASQRPAPCSCGTSPAPLPPPDRGLFGRMLSR